MPRQVICINDFIVTKYDDNGFATNTDICIPKGTTFIWDEFNRHRTIGGDVYLINNKYYIEVSYDTFKKNFKEVRDV